MPAGTYCGGGEDENNLAFSSYYIVLHVMFCLAWHSASSPEGMHGEQ